MSRQGLKKQKKKCDDKQGAVTDSELSDRLEITQPPRISTAGDTDVGAVRNLQRCVGGRKCLTCVLLFGLD